MVFGNLGVLEELLRRICFFIYNFVFISFGFFSLFFRIIWLLFIFKIDSENLLIIKMLVLIIDIYLK